MSSPSVVVVCCECHTTRQAHEGIGQSRSIVATGIGAFLYVAVLN
jgi:hypothetical protein